jgi:N-acetylglutamate synthase-like GNAT family acetyltransferase
MDTLRPLRLRQTTAADTLFMVRAADRRDLDAARELHGRCSARSLRSRYHGPLRDADRYLDHLLDRRFGRSLGVWADGRLIALGHLLRDPAEPAAAELALLVEDAWQHRGVGAALACELLADAHDQGLREVWALAQTANDAMLATMRGLGLPLDYEVADGTITVTASVGSTEAVEALA